MSKTYLLTEEEIKELVLKGYCQAAFDITGISNFSEKDLEELTKGSSNSPSVAESRASDITTLHCNNHELSMSTGFDTGLDDALSASIESYSKAKKHAEQEHVFLDTNLSEKFEAYIESGDLDKAHELLSTIPESPVRMRKAAYLAQERIVAWRNKQQ